MIFSTEVSQLEKDKLQKERGITRDFVKLHVKTLLQKEVVISHLRELQRLNLPKIKMKIRQFRNS